MQVGVVVILFLLYSFAGAVLEHVSYYASELMDPTAPKKLLANPIITGFPLYGLGAYGVVALYQLLFRNALSTVSMLMLEFLTYGSALTALEYGAGRYVGAGTRDKSGLQCVDTRGRPQRVIGSWDYTASAYNLGGIIDVRHFIAFGLLGLLITRVHPYLREGAERALGGA